MWYDCLFVLVMLYSIHSNLSETHMLPVPQEGGRLSGPGGSVWGFCALMEYD